MGIVTAWAPVMASTAVTISLAVLLWRALTAPLEATMGAVLDRVDALDQRLSGRIDALDSKFEYRMDALDKKVEAKFDAFDEKMDSRFETVNYRLSALEGDMTLVKQRLLATAPHL